MERPLRIGTRGSALARAQSGWVASALEAAGHAVEVIVLSTRGDRDRAGAVAALGTQGVFTRELQEALLDGRIDVAVHSLKDLPTEAIAGLVVTAVPVREDVSDVLVSRAHWMLDELPPGATIGTGSLRRQAQLRHLRPDVEFRDLRGNVDTRLAHVADGRLDGVVLAAAGLHRLGRAEEISEYLRPPRLLPAPGQAALGIETRSDDDWARSTLAPLDDVTTHAAVTAERSLLAALSGGCLAPVGAWARMQNPDSLRLTARVVSHDGAVQLNAEGTGAIAQATELGRRVAEQLLSQGAAEIIAASRDGTP